MPKEDIFAVVWHDFIPLFLTFPDGPTAIEKAKEIHARATLAGVSLFDLRAVRLPPHIEDLEDELETLWRPDDDVVSA